MHLWDFAASIYSVIKNDNITYFFFIQVKCRTTFWPRMIFLKLAFWKTEAKWKSINSCLAGAGNSGHQRQRRMEGRWQWDRRTPCTNLGQGRVSDRSVRLNVSPGFNLILSLLCFQFRYKGTLHWDFNNQHM